jgi:transposase-like protein
VNHPSGSNLRHGKLEGVTTEKREYWSKLIAEQEASGQTIRAFCKERGVADQALYSWRKRLRKVEPVQFAELKTVVSTAAPLELVLAGGERLRIANGVDAATLRLVLDALRP